VGGGLVLVGGGVGGGVVLLGGFLGGGGEGVRAKRAGRQEARGGDRDALAGQGY